MTETPATAFVSRAAVPAMFAAALAILASMAALSYRGAQRFREEEAWVSHTHELLAQLKALQSFLVEAESECRGFLITRSPEELASFQKAVARISGQLALLRQMTVNHPAQLQRLEAFEPGVRLRIDRLQRTVEQQSAGPAPSNQQAASTLEGTEEMARIRSQIRDMELQERWLLAQRQAESLRGFWATLAITVLGDLLSFALLLAAFFLMRHDKVELERAEEKFRSLLEAAPDPMVIVDERGRIALVNAQVEKQFDYPRAELLGQSVEILVPERLRQRHAQHRTGYFLEPRTRPMGDGGELYLCRRDGTEIPVEIALSPLQTRQGMLVSCAIRDVAARKDSEARIRHLNRDLRSRTAELEATNKELEAFTYSVAHDLRAPLRQVDGFSRLLLEEHRQALRPEARHYLERVSAGALQMGRLMDDLLNLSRVGRREITRRSTDLGRLVGEVAAELMAEAPGRAVQWRLGPLPVADGDPGLLRLLFLNLLANAVKFTSKCERAVIEVGETQRDGQGVFFVRDNGVGFNMKYSGKLFGVFQRLHRQEDFGGTGVGLATVQRIIRRHGGRIWAESQPGLGATFYFTLNEVEALSQGEPSPARGVAWQTRP